MPKVIENLKERLLEEAKKQLLAAGYETMTISSLAKACGVAVGTVYHYFPSKESILRACIADAWEERVQVIDSVVRYSVSYEAVVHCIYDQVRLFAKEHEYVFRDSVDSDSVYAILLRNSWVLGDRIAGFLRKYCNTDAEADLVARAVVGWLW